MKSKLIVLEGCDGCGKTTMVDNLRENLKKRGFKAHSLVLPCPRSFGYNKIRSILKGEWSYPTDLTQSLFLINMIDTNTRFINPFFEAYSEDSVMLVDRSIISTILYNALYRGSIYTAIGYYLKLMRNEGHTNISTDDSEFDFDIINKEYGRLNHMVDYVFFLQPPKDVVVERALKRHSGEENDNVNSVQRIYDAYDMFYKFLKGHMYRNVVDMIEGPGNVLRPSEHNRDKFIMLDEWNRTLTDKENHNNHMEQILSYIMK